MEALLPLTEAIKFIFPAYCANAAPVLFGGGPPIDMGKSLPDGKPIFGKNKTFKGFISGLIAGTLIGFMESLFFLDYPYFLGFITSLGALIGDLAGAFFKRRLGIEPGEMLPLIDQTDFMIGALIFALPFVEIPATLALTIFMITIPLHLLTNYAAYKLGLKDNPW